MKLDNRQIKNLLDLVVTSKADSIGCDGCYELMDEFAQSELDGRPLSDSLGAVRDHLDNANAVETSMRHC